MRLVIAFLIIASMLAFDRPTAHAEDWPQWMGPQRDNVWRETEIIDRAKVIEPSNVAFGRRVVWAAPAWANRKVFLRNDNECICVDLAAQ